MSLYQGIPCNFTLQTFTEPLMPTGAVLVTRESWSQLHRAIGLVVETETNKAVSTGGGEPKAGSQGGLPGGGIPQRIGSQVGRASGMERMTCAEPWQQEHPGRSGQGQ